MSLEQTLDSSNNTNIATNHNMSGWATAQKMTMDVQHSARNDKYAEIAYQNTIANQQLANQSALDQLNSTRAMNNLIFGALAEKIINLDPTDAVAAGELFKGSSNASILSILSQLGGGQISAKTAMTTPPETGVTQLMAQLNALNSQNYQNNTTNSSLAAANAALANILMKNAYNVPPVGTAPIEKPVQV
jgi:uncharacterized protein YdbL (DUF1318 family)